MLALTVLVVLLVSVASLNLFAGSFISSVSVILFNQKKKKEFREGKEARKEREEGRRKGRGEKGGGEVRGRRGGREKEREVL